MALLNPPEFMPEVARMLTEAVAGGIVDSDNLVALAAPGSVGGDRSAVVKNSLAAATTLGVIVVDAGKSLSVSPAVRDAFNDHGSLRPIWGDILLTHLLSHESRHDAIGQNVGDGEEASKDARDLFFGATWFLAQDAGGAYTWGSSDSARNIEGLLNEQVPNGGRSLSKDSSRWDSLKRWLIPLGLAEPVPTGSGLRPVPTARVRRILQDEVGHRGEDAVPVRDFCDVLGREVPLLWPGAARTELAVALGADPDGDVQAGGVDSSIGLALEHLEFVEQVVLENRADSSQRTLLRASSSDPDP